jgi:Bacterial extracellular solute-binding proteins, family 5 Middle
MVSATRTSTRNGITVGLSIAVALAACRPGTGGPAPEAGCVLNGQLTLDTIDVVIDSVVGADLFETLVRLPCDAGPIVPVLVTTVERVGSGGTWRVTLRKDAHFTDGTPLTAASVKASWLVHEGDASRPWADSVDGSVRVVDDSTLEIRLLDRGSGAISALADPTLAISKGETSSAGWGIGTSRYAVDRNASTSGVIAIPVAQAATDRLPVIRYSRPFADPRDALDGGIGLVRVRDPLTVEYAHTLSGYTVHALDPERVYVMVAPSRRDESGLRMPAGVLRDVDSESGSEPAPPTSAWWRPSETCPSVPARGIPPTAAPQIAYPAGDPKARDLAERLVALARAGTLDSVIPGLERLEGRLVARPYAGNRYAAALERGAATAFVFPVTRFPFEACTATHELQHRMPWSSLADLEQVIVPLVETRAYAITREGIGPVEVEWDRSLHLAVVHR